jgi:hypothetical protein
METSPKRLRGNPEVGGNKSSKPVSRPNPIANPKRAGGLHGDKPISSRARPRRAVEARLRPSECKLKEGGDG